MDSPSHKALMAQTQTLMMPMNEEGAETLSSLALIDLNTAAKDPMEIIGSFFRGDSLLFSSKKVEDDIESQGKKILQHEDNIKYFKNLIRKSLDPLIAQMQASLGNHPYRTKHMSEGHVHHLITRLEETVEHILQHDDKSAAAVICDLTRRYHQANPPPAPVAPILSDVLGVLATLGTVDDINLSTVLSEYLGLDTMLALVCKTYDGVKTLETYDEEGLINRTTGLYGLGASIGRNLEGRFHVICLEQLMPYGGEFMTNDPQRRLALIKPKLPNGESPAGFIAFAVNMIYIDSDYLSFVTENGHGLRETLYYKLLSHLQVYRTRKDMMQALPCISTGAISLDGGIIRRPHAMFSLGSTRKELDVSFGVCCGDDCFPSEQYIERENKIKKLKWKKERMMSDMEREEALLAHEKHKFEVKKEELLKFMAQQSLDQMQQQQQQQQQQQEEEGGEGRSTCS
ncbi:hypothetical protein Ccrd_014042 [Cynara cardunculus var. scolymus]|uniref:Uncharacterized protein n=1 Tax=Cynara cardunculus var. scolymus TaxID=59895 RepID=A0A118K4J3_CYNCS|nr:hypothetical protein Ccrd_014042 [Cynara cardunculus var. scolymus]